MNPNQLCGLTDTQIADTAQRFQRFSVTWNVPAEPPALKMFLACAVDTAMHELNIAEIPDEEWENFYERVLTA